MVRLPSSYERLKRIADFVISGIMLILSSPILVATAILLLRSIGSPVIFRQQRPGLRGVPFTIYKFRTMSNKRDSSGHLLPDEDRVSRVGRVIRALSLDELPTLLNVIKGEMSLVGPRPLMMQYLDRYNAHQMRRHEVLPGVTGWVQVNGRNALTWEEKFDMDVWYVDHRSFRLDLKILIMTVWKVLKREGISEQGHVSASEFMGSTNKGV